MTELEASGRAPMGDAPPPYMIFVVVFLFFLTGLLGFLICHLLKKKGYRCRAGDMDDEEEEEEKLGANVDDADEDNQDTVEQILKCIIENEANMEAFNEMLGNQNVCVRHDPRLRKESIGGIPPHLHTVHSGTDLNTCHLCAQIKSKKGRRPSRTPRFKQRPGEQTVFSVGRFRVTHTDKKPHGGSNPLVASGDQLDQLQDSVERKESGHNLRNLFKDARPPSESSNGVTPNVGKRRRSLTIFGLRRGSDPIGVKGVEGLGRDTGGGKFAIQQQPVVLEEPLRESIESSPKPETEPMTRASPQNEATPSDSFKTNEQAGNVNTFVKDDSKHGSSTEPSTGLTTVPIVTGPSSLPISLASSDVTERKHMDSKTFKNEEDPGPLQTSTPISPMPGSITGLTPITFTPHPDQDSRNVPPLKQTPPDPCSSPDLEPSFGASPALISLGSSPPSFPSQTMSSGSLLKTPTSPLTITPSPKLSSRSIALESAKPVLTPSLKLSALQVTSSEPPSPSLGKSASPSQSQPPSPALDASPKLEIMQASPQTSSLSPADQNPSFEGSPHLTARSAHATSAPPTNLTKGDVVSSPISQKESDQSDQLSKDRLNSLPLLPSSPLSPSSPIGSRVSSVTIVKASPDSKREFSVVTMVEETEQDASQKRQRAETFLSSTGEPESQRGETSGAEITPSVSQDKDDMVEMEDIKDCKVAQVEEEEKVEETDKRQDPTPGKDQH
ncbi:RELT-like protein 2 [Sphaeramia orbicularis]|uniref:Proline-rich protein 36-like n=1 Tax=Sphaeramia orbicularis TaxID=375764 RepID=A0A672ZP74_9TELE|nr:proline-rich protein 36-like [Sphaeramia orbicularis]XP_030002314.1 proline-rich protein 36-like [Sphaeramia orbicularis]